MCNYLHCLAGISFGWGRGLQIRKNKKLGRIPRLGKTFDISFSVRPTRWLRYKWASVLHMTTNGNVGPYGYRIPGVFFRPTFSRTVNRLHICYSVSGSGNYCYNSGYYHLNMWIRIRVQQVRRGSYYYYNIYLNGQRKLHVRNTRPRVFRNVKLYAGDPWYYSQPGYIKNIRVGVRG